MTFPPSGAGQPSRTPEHSVQKDKFNVSAVSGSLSVDVTEPPVREGVNLGALLAPSPIFQPVSEKMLCKNDTAGLLSFQLGLSR